MAEGTSTPKAAKPAKRKTLDERFDLETPGGRVQAVVADRAEAPVSGRQEGKNRQGTEMRPKGSDGPLSGPKHALYRLQAILGELSTVNGSRGSKWTEDKFKEAQKALDEAKKAAS